MKLSYMARLFVVTGLGMVACSKKESSKNGPTPPVVLPPPKDGSSIDLTDRNERLKVAFEGLIQSCEAAGGTFDSHTRNCVCPETDTPKSFQALTKIISENGSKKRVFDHFECKEQLSIKPATVGVSSFRDLLSKGNKTFRDDLARTRTLGNGRVLEFRLPNDASDQSLTDLATYLDEHDVRVGVPNGNQRVEGFYVSLLHSKGFMARTERVSFFDFEDVAQAERPGNEIFAWTTKDLQKLQYKASSSAISLTPIEGPNTEFLEGLRYFQSYLLGDAKANVKEDVLIIDKGCDVVCDFSASFTYKGRFYWYEKNYARGQHFRHALYMGHEDGKIDAMAVLFSDYSPSAIVTEKASIGSAGNVSVTTEGFDSQQQLVDTAIFEVLGDSDFYEKLGRLDRFDSQSPQTTAIYLEGRTQLEEGWEESFWLRGPYAADFPNTDGSAMGWLKTDSPELSLVNYFSGVFDAGYYTSAKHVREVLHDIVKDFKRGEAYAIPADLMSATSNRLKELASLSKSRVTTISSIFPISEAECNRLFSSDDGGLLWIAGAGNEAVENPRFRCPQRLRRDGLKIVVASGDRSGLADHAEYGLDYADIVADPTSYLGRHGSSYAAPKVTNVALKIIRKFGNGLSNREIRLAILLGADVDVQKRLKVRTGGALNEGFALKAAEAIIGLTSGERALLVTATADRRQVFEKVLLTSSALAGSSARDQAEYLQNANL